MTSEELKKLFGPKQKTTSKNFSSLIDEIFANAGSTPLLKKTETEIQVSYDEGDTFDTLFLLKDIEGKKGDKGDPGKNAGPGLPGKDAPTITEMNLSYGEDGKISSGTLKLSDNTNVPIKVEAL